MKKSSLKPETVFDSLIEATLMCFGEEKHMEALKLCEPIAVLRAEQVVSNLVTVAYEFEGSQKLTKRQKKEIAEFKAAGLSFLRNLRKRGILSNLAAHPKAGVASKFQQLIRLGDVVCAGVCPKRRMQYRLNFS